MNAVKPKNEITLGQKRILLNGRLEQRFRASQEVTLKYATLCTSGMKAFTRQIDSVRKPARRARKPAPNPAFNLTRPGVFHYERDTYDGSFVPQSAPVACSQEESKHRQTSLVAPNLLVFSCSEFGHRSTARLIGPR